MNVLVLGVTGMLGNAVFRVLSSDKRLKVFGTMREDSYKRYFPINVLNNLITNIDADNNENLKSAFEISKPEVVINCIGVIKQLSAAKNALSTIALNTLLPHRLALLSQEYSARLILISTDCVFSGKKGGYTEADFPDCDDLYGRSKLLGEIVDTPNVLTIRTSIIGHELKGGHSLVNWFLNSESVVKGYTNAFFSGLPTNELAIVIKDIILQYPELYGLYHVSGNRISKYELLDLIATAYQIKTNIIESKEVHIDRSLNHQKFSGVTNYTPKKWPELITSMHQFYTGNYSPIDL